MQAVFISQSEQTHRPTKTNRRARNRSR